jgi:hypothetical protein
MIKRAFISWASGVVAWMLGVGLSVYEDITSLILQPIIGGVIFAVAVAIAAPIGFWMLRLPTVRRLTRSWIPGSILLAGGFALIGISAVSAFAGHYTDPDTGETFRTLNPILAYSGFTCVVFGPLFAPIGVRHESQKTS